VTTPARGCALFAWLFCRWHKRIALAVIDVFLQMNGRELAAEEVDAVEIMQSVAAGKLTEEQLTKRISEHVRAT
jgi:prophage maintenance system killer protein